MFTGTSTFKTSTPYCGFENSSMLRATISGFLRANSMLLFVSALFVADEFEKKRHVGSDAFRRQYAPPRHAWSH